MSQSSSSSLPTLPVSVSKCLLNEAHWTSIEITRPQFLQLLRSNHNVQRFHSSKSGCIFNKTTPVSSLATLIQSNLHLYNSAVELRTLPNGLTHWATTLFTVPLSHVMLLGEWICNYSWQITTNKIGLLPKLPWQTRLRNVNHLFGVCIYKYIANIFIYAPTRLNCLKWL